MPYYKVAIERSINYAMDVFVQAETPDDAEYIANEHADTIDFSEWEELAQENKVLCWWEVSKDDSDEFITQEDI